MEDYRVGQEQCQEWVRKCVCAHDKSCCTGNIKGYMACLVEDSNRTAIGYSEYMSCRIPALK